MGSILGGFKRSCTESSGKAYRLSSEDKSREGVDDRGNEEDDYSSGEGTIGKKLLFRWLVKDKEPSSPLTLECYSSCELPKGVGKDDKYKGDEDKGKDKESDCGSQKGWESGKGQGDNSYH